MVIDWRVLFFAFLTFRDGFERLEISFSKVLKISFWWLIPSNVGYNLASIIQAWEVLHDSPHGLSLNRFPTRVQRWNEQDHCQPTGPIGDWSVVWNMFVFFPYLGNNNPNALSYFSEGCLYHQPGEVTQLHQKKKLREAARPPFALHPHPCLSCVGPCHSGHRRHKGCWGCWKGGFWAASSHVKLQNLWNHGIMDVDHNSHNL